MQLPNLPTDNLYKFMALFGLIGLMFFITTSFYAINSLEDEIIKLNTKKINFKYELREFQKRDSILSIDLNNTSTKISKYLPLVDSINRKNYYDELRTDLQDAEYRSYLEFYFKYKEKLFPDLEKYNSLVEKKIERRKVLEVMSRKAHDINRLSDVVLEKNNRLKSFKNIYLWSYIFCAFIMMSGFTLWYIRVQVFLDRKLKNEVTSSP